MWTMSSADRPQRVAFETLRGDVQTAPVLDDDTDVRDCRPVERLLIDLPGADANLWVDRDDVVEIDPDDYPEIHAHDGSRY